MDGATVVAPKTVSLILLHSGVNNNKIGSMIGRESTMKPNGTKISLIINALMANIMGILAKIPAVMVATIDLRRPNRATPPVCRMSPITLVIICS